LTFIIQHRHILTEHESSLQTRFAAQKPPLVNANASKSVDHILHNKAIQWRVAPVGPFEGFLGGPSWGPCMKPNIVALRAKNAALSTNTSPVCVSLYLSAYIIKYTVVRCCALVRVTMIEYSSLLASLFFVPVCVCPRIHIAMISAPPALKEAFILRSHGGLLFFRCP
jgi:hypothetical protein